MGDLVRFGVSMDKGPLAQFGQLIWQLGYANRSVNRSGFPEGL